MSGRDEILGRIRTALRDRPQPPPVHREYRTADDPDPRSPAELTALLVDRLTDYRATVHTLPPDEVRTAVADALRRRSARRVIVPDGLSPEWLPATPDVQIEKDDPPLRAADLDAIDGVITTCAVAIAETGTLVLDGGSGQGRRALTLVPDYHLVIVPSDRLVAGVPAALTRLSGDRPLTWISGPSATSDIELERVEGVHGPRNLEVIVMSR